MRSDRWILYLFVFTVFSTGFILGFYLIPLGIPGEWTWQRNVPESYERLDALLGFIETGLVATLCITFILLGAKRIAQSNKKESAFWIVGLVAVGFLWLWSVQKMPPSGKPVVKPSWVLYSPDSSGYFFDAAYEIDDLSKYLAEYESLMEEGDVLHKGTHPPGLFVLHKFLIRVCEHADWLTALVLSTRPDTERETFDYLHDKAKVKRTSGTIAEPLSEAQQAALWLGILLTQLAAVMTVVPLYFLARLRYDRSVSWVVASLWIFVPAMGVFLPKSDALYPVIGMTFLAFWLYALKNRSRVLAIFSGVVFWLGMTLSLALLPIAVVGVLMTVKELVPSSREHKSLNLKKMIELVTLSVGSFALLCFAVWAVCDLNLFNVWIWNYRNHAGFYEKQAGFEDIKSNPRSYFPWLLVDVGELGFGVGLPIFIAAVCGLILVLKKRTSWPAKLFTPVVCVFVVWGLLWLSGKNMGEAARLWLVVMPLFVWSSAEICERFVIPKSDDASWWNSPLFFLVLAQTLCCMFTVYLVDGFPV